MMMTGMTPTARPDYRGGEWVNLGANTNNSDLKNNYGSIRIQIGEDEIETWLVTPEIDMDNTTGVELSFEVQASFDNGTILSVLFSTNFTGDVTTADWQALDVDIPTGPAGGFDTFVTVDPVNISCIEGTMYLAFVYRGSDPSATTRYHIDNIEITGN